MRERCSCPSVYVDCSQESTAVVWTILQSNSALESKKVSKDQAPPLEMKEMNETGALLYSICLAFHLDLSLKVIRVVCHYPYQ